MDQGDLTPPDPIVDLSTINPMENYPFVDDLLIYLLWKNVAIFHGQLSSFSRNQLHITPSNFRFIWMIVYVSTMTHSCYHFYPPKTKLHPWNLHQDLASNPATQQRSMRPVIAQVDHGASCIQHLLKGQKGDSTIKNGGWLDLMGHTWENHRKNWCTVGMSWGYKATIMGFLP